MAQQLAFTMVKSADWSSALTGGLTLLGNTSIGTEWNFNHQSAQNDVLAAVAKLGRLVALWRKRDQVRSWWQPHALSHHSLQGKTSAACSQIFKVGLAKHMSVCTLLHMSLQVMRRRQGQALCPTAWLCICRSALSKMGAHLECSLTTHKKIHVFWLSFC